MSTGGNDPAHEYRNRTSGGSQRRLAADRVNDDATYPRRREIAGAQNAVHAVKPGFPTLPTSNSWDAEGWIGDNGQGSWADSPAAL